MYAIRLQSCLMSLTNCGIAYENLYACKSETFCDVRIWEVEQRAVDLTNPDIYCKQQHPVYHLSRHEFPSFGNYVKMQIVTLYQAIATKYLKIYLEDVKDVAIK